MKRRRPRAARRRRKRLPAFLRRLIPDARTRRRWWRWFRAAPVTIRVGVIAAAVLTTWLCVNGIYQVIRKPSELFFPVSGTLYKTPVETWERYEPIFRKHATSVISPELLAALAQVE